MTAQPNAHPARGQNQPLSFPIAFAALVMGAVAMGISPVFVRFAEVGPFASAFWRVALALPLLLLWALWEAKKAGLSLRQATVLNRAVILSGVFFAGDLIFWHLAILNTTIANATLMACLAPVWVLLLSGIFIGEKVRPAAYLGLALCLIGAALLIGSSFTIAPERLAGDIYGFITSLFFGLYFLAIRVARRTHGAGALTLVSTAITAALLLLVALAAGQSLWPQTATGVAALLALGLVSHSGGQGLLAVALGSLSAGFASLVIFVEALAAALFGWLVFAEILTPLQGIGGCLILWGIWAARPR
ncbi:MAG: DMT family transporter [Pseudomonadota bacterium]